MHVRNRVQTLYGFPHALASTGCGEDDGDARSLIGDAVENYLTAMRFGKAAHDGKSKPGTLVGNDRIVTALTKTLEDLVMIFGSDADAGIVDAKRERAVLEDVRERGDAAGVTVTPATATHFVVSGRWLGSKLALAVTTIRRT
jgi:isopentenyl phosphate kinase